MSAHPADRGIPESPKVADHRMDMEACRLTWRERADRRHHEVSTGRHGWVLDVLVPVVIVAVIVGLIYAAALLGELDGGWPA